MPESWEDVTEKVVLHKELKLKEGARHAQTWRESMPAKGTTSATTLGRECPQHVGGGTEGLVWPERAAGRRGGHASLCARHLLQEERRPTEHASSLRGVPRRLPAGMGPLDTFCRRDITASGWRGQISNLLPQPRPEQQLTLRKQLYCQSGI